MAVTPQTWLTPLSTGPLVPLLNNAALLLALAVAYGAFGLAPERNRSLGRKLGVGLLLSALGLLVMANAWALRPGVVFDTRSVVLGLAGLFFGAIPVAVAVVVTTAYRIWLGGVGTIMGVGVIVSSAAVGLAWRRARGRRLEDLSLTEYYLFGIVVHLVMVAWMVALPAEVRSVFFRSVGVPVMVVFPAATALLAWVMLTWNQRLRVEETARELAEARKHLTALVEAAPLAIIGLDLEGRVTAWNAGAERLFLWRREEVIGRRYPLVADVGWQEFVTASERTLAGSPLHGDETVRTRKDGSPVHVRMHTAVLRDAAGEPRGYVGIMEDATEANRAERERREAEEARRRVLERLEKAQRVGNVGFLDWEFATNEIRWSDEVYRMYGVEKSDGPETLESTVSLVHPEDAERVGRALDEAVRDQADYHIVHRMVRPDGRVIWVRAQGELEYDDAGTPARLLGTVVDVTELMEAERERRGSEERYLRLFRHALSADYIATPDGRLIDCNPTFLRLFGFASREEALATPLTALHKSPTAFAALVERLEEKGSVEAAEGRYVRRDGAPLHVLESAVAERDEDGRLVEITGFVVDISERTALEVQLRHAQKMEALGRLAGGVAHDFNNNLAVILGHAELARENLPWGHPVRDDLTIIEHAGERSAGLTRQLLAFSRKQSVDPVVLDLDDVVRNSEIMLKRLIGENIRLEFQRAPECGHVRIDPAQVEQVLVNLVINARDAVEGDGTITVSTGRTAFTHDVDDAGEEGRLPPGEYAVLTVADTGHGMDPEVLERAFEPFFTTKKEGLGTGLGLSTLYGIVKQNGGGVQVESAPGSGTRFRVFLPLFHGNEAPTRRRDEGAEAAGTETVLVAEDEPAVLALVTKVLERCGYTVLAAATPGEAIDLAREHDGEIHLLLTDVVMPEMNGVQLRDRIEAIRPGIRTLFASGYTDDVIVHSGVLDEDASFLQKPFTVRALTTRVRQVLEA